MRNRIVYACDTPLQVLNAINMQENQYANCESDIFVYNQFGNAEMIAKKLEEVRIFKNVYLVERYNEYPKSIQKFATLIRMLFPYLTLKKYIDSKTKVKREKYNIVVFSFVTTFSVTIFGMSKATKFIQLEDGMGTYVGDILNDYTSEIFKKIANITKYNHIFKPKEIFLYNSEMYSGNVPTVKLANSFSQELNKKIEYVYGYVQNDLYKNNKCIYLSQPIQNVEGYNVQNHGYINRILENYKQEVLVRIHPREQENSYKGFRVDTIKNLWELECIHQIDNDSILIGCFSTAQLMPKVLKNKEPYVIFLYKLIIENVENEYWKEINCFIDKFKSFYHNPEKIFIPQTIEEFETMLFEVLKVGEKHE